MLSTWFLIPNKLKHPVQWKIFFFFKNKIRRHSLFLLNIKSHTLPQRNSSGQHFKCKTLAVFLSCCASEIQSVILFYSSRPQLAVKLLITYLRIQLLPSGFWEQNSFDIHTACNTPWELGVLNIPPQERNIFWVYFNSDKPEFWLSIYD